MSVLSYRGGIDGQESAAVTSGGDGEVGDGGIFAESECGGVMVMR
jgi:hypothetical protein